MHLAPITPFGGDERGHFGTLMAVLIVPVALAAGVAVDFTSINARRALLQQALDSAALSIAREGKKMSDERAHDVAERYVAANFDPHFTELGVVRSGTRVEVAASARAGLAFGALLGYDDWKISAASSADVAYNNYEIALVLDTTGSMEGGKLQAMKDAVTGLVETMSSQITDTEKLRFAVVPFANFVNVGAKHGPGFDKNGKVRKDTGADWLDLKGKSEIPQVELVAGLSRFELFNHLKQDWKGCVETRHGAGKAAYDVADLPATEKDKGSLFVPALSIDEPDERGYANSYISSSVDPFDKSPANQIRKLLKYGVNDVLTVVTTLTTLDTGWIVPAVDFSRGKGPNKDCVTQPILPLGNDYRAIKAKVHSLKANGTTNIMEGVAWGMRVLSPGAPFTEGSKPGPGNEKIMIVLTDGANVFGNKGTKFGSSYSSQGYLLDGRLGITTGSASDTNALMNAKTLAACENAKKDGVIIYTIRLEEPDVTTGMMLKDCASSSQHFFDAPSRKQLDDVFQAISEGVVRIRISS